MISVGENSYVTLEEAETMAAYTCLSSDKAYLFWKELSDSDKSVLLVNSCRAIDNLKFSGRRRSLGQHLEFPRVDNHISGIGYRLYVGQMYDNGLYSQGNADGGLSLVKQAQVINAIYAGYFNEMAVYKIAMEIQGLTSKRAGPISETYGRTGYNSGGVDAVKGIFTTKVYSLLTPWLNTNVISY